MIESKVAKKPANCTSWRHGNTVYTDRIQRESGNFRYVYVDCVQCKGVRGIRLMFKIDGEFVTNEERIKRGITIAELR